eukprot:197391-Pyramimonas_sp.AAC.1
MENQFLSAPYQQCCASGTSTRITRCNGCRSGCPRCRRSRRRAAEAPALAAAATLLWPAVLLSLQLLSSTRRC